MSDQESWSEAEFPCTITLTIPFPTAHLASTALRVLSVDQELSPLVRRRFNLTTTTTTTTSTSTDQQQQSQPEHSDKEEDMSILCVSYAATTNRMLRVSVNGFMESVGVVLGVMSELDTDVVYGPIKGGLEGVQGLEEGRVG